MHIAEALARVTVGPEVTFRNLTVFPLLGAGVGEPSYLTLDEALARGWVRVTEVSEAGSVPQLKVVNSGADPVLLLDGEELVGAKQNRILNLTILIPAKTTIVVPVSCVEAGRWHARSRAFTTAPRTHYAAGRAAKVAQVSFCLAESGERRANQGAIWDDIAHKSARLGARSDTAAMAAMFEAHGADLEQYLEAFPPRDGQVGAVFVIDGRAAGVELFDTPATWRKLAPKVVSSYALDAIDARGPRDRRVSAARRAGLVRPAAIAPFLAAVREAKAESFPAIGAGTDVRLSGDGLAGAALVVDDRVLHLCAFGLNASGVM